MTARTKKADIVAETIAQAQQLGASPEELATVTAVAEEAQAKLDAKDPSFMKEITGAFRKGSNSASFDGKAATDWALRQVNAAAQSPLVLQVLRYTLFVAVGAALAFIAYTGITWLAGGLLWLTGSVLIAKIVFIAGVAWLSIKAVWQVWKVFTEADYSCASMDIATVVATLGAAAYTNVAGWLSDDEEAQPA